MSLGPGLKRALVLSRDETGELYQELFELPLGERIGSAVVLPVLEPEELHLVWAPDERYVFYVNDRILFITHVETKGNLTRTVVGK